MLLKQTLRLRFGITKQSTPFCAQPEYPFEGFNYTSVGDGLGVGKE
jgi:hypothetical protein